MGYNDDRSNRGNRFNSGPREMHKAKCSECGKDCEVPFKPTEGKPVYCRECYSKRKPSYGSFNRNPSYGRDNEY
ncbi:MAG: CxxC-x17-CxxC domain-containing protein [archaeon]